MKKRITMLIIAMVIMLSFTGRTYASEGDAKSKVNEGGSFLDWFVRRPSEIEPFYKQYGDYIYAGGELELKQYFLPGKLRIEKSIDFPQSDTNAYYGNRLVINAREIVITGDVTVNNYVQIHALPIADEDSDEEKGSGNFIISGDGKLTTTKIEGRAIREGIDKDFTVVSATGDFHINDNAIIDIQEDGKGTVIKINGDFIANSKSVTNLSYGEIKVGGNVDLQKKFISKGESEITLIDSGKTDSGNRTIKGTSDSEIKTLKLSFDALKRLKIKKKWLQKGYFQCTKIVFDYHSHTIPTNIIDTYYSFDEIHGNDVNKNDKQIVNYAKSFLYTIIFTNKLGKVDINKTFLHTEGGKNEKSSIYTCNIEKWPATVTFDNKNSQAVKISLQYIGVGKPVKMGSSGFAMLSVELENGKKYEYLVSSKLETISEEDFMDSLRTGASDAIKDLAKDVLMDQVVSDLLDISKEFEWKAGVVTGNIGKAADFLDKLDKRLEEWRNIVKGFPDFENSETEMIPAVENHTQAGLEISGDSNESGANDSSTTGISGDEVKSLYEQTIAEYDKMMREGQLSYREKNRDTYEEADRYTYYTIVDIDGNGVDELILRFDHQDANHWTNQDSGYGESTYVYTIKDGVVVNVLLPESSVQGFAPDFVHLGFTKIYKGTNLINRGMYHLPQDDIFYSYQDGVLSKDPVLEITRGGDTWLINNEEKTSEECIKAYNTAANNDEGYELQLYERETDKQELSSSTSDLIEEYKAFIHSQTDGIDYLIYDIDKDSFPELFIEKEHTGEEYTTGREYVHEIYTYKDGDFKLIDTWSGSGYNGQDPDVYASFPNENGILVHAIVWGFESLVLYTLDGEKFEYEVMYDVSGAEPIRYYLDEDDQVFKDSRFHNTYINHQYYIGEAQSPYCDGSYLLAQSDMNDYTALCEAFDDEKTPQQPAQERNEESDYSEISAGTKIEALKVLVGKTIDEIPYETKDAVLWGKENYRETINTVELYNREGTIWFEYVDDVIVNVFWLAGGTIRYEEIDEISQIISDTIGIQPDLRYIDTDEYYWDDTSENVEYYVWFHESPITIGVKRL